MRHNERQRDQIRKTQITRGFIKNALGSALIEMEDTKVICTATLEDKIPPFLKNSPKGWLSAEYAMLPAASSKSRTSRERPNVSGRSQEIQRLIGRSLRLVVDLSCFRDKTIWLDCDVIQADGGTRTASITGSYVALCDALINLRRNNHLEIRPIIDRVVAVSLGRLNGELLLDLDYSEDSTCETDMNIVMTEAGKFVEIQGTAEKSPFSRSELSAMLELAEKGCRDLLKLQEEVLGDDLNLLRAKI